MAQTDTTAILERMTDVLEALQANAPIKEPGFSSQEYQQRLRDEGFNDEFPVRVFQNGFLANPRGIPADIRAKVAELKDGKFLGGAVEVQHSSKGDVLLWYKAGTTDDRMRFQSVASSFEDLIQKLWTASRAA
jgi:hypothetical protein